MNTIKNEDATFFENETGQQCMYQQNPLAYKTQKNVMFCITRGMDKIWWPRKYYILYYNQLDRREGLWLNTRIAWLLY